jgi:hypothetical protein
MKSNKVTKTILTLVLFFSLSAAFAQLPEDPDDTVDPIGAPLNPAPIGDYLIPMLVLGMATAFILLKKKAPAQV